MFTNSFVKHLYKSQSILASGGLAMNASMMKERLCIFDRIPVRIAVPVTMPENLLAFCFATRRYIDKAALDRLSEHNILPSFENDYRTFSKSNLETVGTFPSVLIMSLLPLAGGTVQRVYDLLSKARDFVSPVILEESGKGVTLYVLPPLFGQRKKSAGLLRLLLSTYQSRPS